MLSRFVPGNIRNYQDRWESLTSDRDILQTVSGLKVEFMESNAPLPSPRISYSSNSKSRILKSEISSLESRGIITKVAHVPGEILSPVFLKEKSDGSHRLILNLRDLNDHVEKIHFKMETISSILKLIKKDAYMVKLDIKDAYYSVPISSDHQKYFRFQFGEHLYQYTVLPNGFSPGPRKFTKLLKPVFAELRKKLILVAGYLDDLLSSAILQEECIRNLVKIINLLISLGFYINVPKSVFTPSQIMEFLGFIIDSCSMTIRLTPKKVSKMIDLCNQILSSRKLTIRMVASLLGKISSSLIAVEFGRLHYRSLERCKLSALESSQWNFNAKMKLDEAARLDILWWRNNVKGSYKSFAVSNPSITISTDACDIGWGASLKDTRAGGLFSHSEIDTHINVKELMACSFGLRSLLDDLFDIHALVLMDNTSAVQALNKMGSMKSLDLDIISKDIWEWAMERKISLSASHIPGIFNKEADIESRKDDRSLEWSLNPEDFDSLLQELEFSPEIDLFASRLNAKIHPFVSYRPDPLASHVNAFSLDWSDLPFYAFPPFPCISSCIQKVVQDRATGIIIVPDWPNQIWYPEILRLAVSNRILFPARKNLLLLPTDDASHHPIWKRLPLIGVVISGKL